jgi:aspartate carbamoyltransferase catalytic subunit
MPEGVAELGANVIPSFDEALTEKPDAVMMLRVQKERMSGDYLPSVREYAANWSLNLERLERLSDKAVILHPGPMNRGLEISSAAADDPRSKVLQQVKNGLAVRMAVLHRLLSGEEEK